MSDYRVLARKYRPQRFREVLGQDAIVTTLKNAIKRNTLAHAYLFCGARGTGKTTLARVFAKALNCAHPTEDLEPCNECPSCKEITAGNSLDVLEIDGASNRGIDDVRRLNETVGYASSCGKYKIYIIDEVHMLTKEAFNALLKTLEEPPPMVKFFFATTEPHKVIPTILSRCQRFNLSRIPTQQIVGKLQEILTDLSIKADPEALLLLANRADGGLRDAESLLDQIIAFHESKVTVENVSTVLGLMPRDAFFALDQAGKEGRLDAAFEIANQVFTEGKEVGYFVDCLIEHFRNILLVQLSGKMAPFLSLSDNERNKYEAAANLYRKDQCMSIIDYLIDIRQHSRFTSSGRIAIEAILLHILRTHQGVPISALVHRLAALEEKITSPTAQPKADPVAKPKVINEPFKATITEDPIPLKSDLPTKEKPKTSSPQPKESAPIELGARLTEEAKASQQKQQSWYDTMLQFASVELEGTIKNKQQHIIN